MMIMSCKSPDKKKKAKKAAVEAAKKAKAASAKLKLAEKKAKAEGKKKQAAQVRMLCRDGSRRPLSASSCGCSDGCEIDWSFVVGAGRGRPTSKRCRRQPNWLRSTSSRAATSSRAG